MADKRLHLVIDGYENEGWFDVGIYGSGAISYTNAHTKSFRALEKARAIHPACDVLLAVGSRASSDDIEAHFFFASLPARITKEPKTI